MRARVCVCACVSVCVTVCVRVCVYLCIEVVCQAVEELALDGVLLREQREVMAQLVVRGDDGALAVLVELGPPGTPEDLHHVQDPQVHQGAPLGVVNLSALLPRQRQRNVGVRGRAVGSDGDWERLGETG